MTAWNKSKPNCSPEKLASYCTVFSVMQTSVRGGVWLSLWKAFASTVAQTPGDNALHTDAFQDAGSKALVVGCSYRRTWISEPVSHRALSWRYQVKILPAPPQGHPCTFLWSLSFPTVGLGRDLCFRQWAEQLGKQPPCQPQHNPTWESSMAAPELWCVGTPRNPALEALCWGVARSTQLSWKRVVMCC